MAFPNLLLGASGFHCQNACMFQTTVEKAATTNRCVDSTAEYKSANPDVALAEASQRAKALETSIFGAATEVVS